MTTETMPFHGVRPGSPAPALELPLVGGGTFRLAEATPALFTMLVFNRGLHCPVCRAQLSELDRRFDELAEKGIDVVSISGENEQRATRMRDEWKIRKVPLAYDLSEPQMREWGLFVSRAINDGEPAVFNEPALFLISPDSTVYYEAISPCPSVDLDSTNCSAVSITGPPITILPAAARSTKPCTTKRTPRYCVACHPGGSGRARSANSSASAKAAVFGALARCCSSSEARSRFELSRPL
jgi:peroxiredoxin